MSQTTSEVPILIPIYSNFIGGLLKNKRKLIGINQREISIICDIAPSSISSIESDRYKIPLTKMETFGNGYQFTNINDFIIVVCYSYFYDSMTNENVRFILRHFKIEKNRNIQVCKQFLKDNIKQAQFSVLFDAGMLPKEYEHFISSTQPEETKENQFVKIVLQEAISTISTKTEETKSKEEVKHTSSNGDNSRLIDIAYINNKNRTVIIDFNEMIDINQFENIVSMIKNINVDKMEFIPSSTTGIDNENRVH